ncbi:MAG: hypothetical protein WDO74_06410 [Pseudomonadota bacterium]
MRSSVLVFAVSLLTLPATAQAHFTLLMPTPASKSTNGGKGDPPCGPTDQPSNIVTPAQGGHLIKINLDETTAHPGFYRIALSLNSRSELPPDNVVRDSSKNILLPTSTGMSATADVDPNPKFPVLADNLWVHTSKQPSTFFVTESEPSTACTPGVADPPNGPHCVWLPNVTCEKCTLQVIEFMANHGSNGAKAGFFYHHCADLKITADPNLPAFGSGGAGSGGASSGGASGAAGSPSGGAAGASAGSGGTGGTAGSPSAGTSGGGSTGVNTAGAPAAAGSPSSAGAATAAGGVSTASTSDAADSGGCSVSNHAAGSTPLLSLLLGLLVLGRRRDRHR